MNNNNFVTNIKIEKILSIIFIIIGLSNIYADNILIKAEKFNDLKLRKKADEIFLFGLIVSYILYIVIVARAYSFYIDKKNSGKDATPELQRLYGSIIILVGFSIIFYYFINNNFGENNPPVL
ncbi:MAG: hypothetical protein R3Y13_03895 [bacterium]